MRKQTELYVLFESVFGSTERSMSHVQIRQHRIECGVDIKTVIQKYRAGKGPCLLCRGGERSPVVQVFPAEVFPKECCVVAQHLAWPSFGTAGKHIHGRTENFPRWQRTDPRTDLTPKHRGRRTYIIQIRIIFNRWYIGRTVPGLIGSWQDRRLGCGELSYQTWNYVVLVTARRPHSATRAKLVPGLLPVNQSGNGLPGPVLSRVRLSVGTGNVMTLHRRKTRGCFEDNLDKRARSG